MDTRKRLVKFLSDLRALQLSNERQAFVGNMGFDRLRSKIKWEGDAQAFADHLVLVLTRQGRKTLLDFVANLRDSSLVGVDRKEELEKMRLAIADLKHPQWIREFVFVAIPVRWVALGLALFLLAASPLLWFGYQVMQAPAEMTGTFNIALADFAQLDENGQTKAIEDGRTMSTWLFKGLTTESLGANFWIWHDSMSVTEKRVQIGIIPGRTSEERRSNAARLARSINADMLVYGVLTSGPNPDLSLEFYVAPLNGQADEILGTYALGSPLSVSLPIRYSDTRAEVEEVLLERSGVVTLFMQGLNKEKNRRPLEALDFFKKALEPRYWGGDTQGQEVVYHFIGRQHLTLGDDYERKGDKEKALEEYKKAYEAFQQSKKQNPSYARAYIGTGHIYHKLASRVAARDRATMPCSDSAYFTGVKETVELPCIELAVTEYRQAVDYADRPGGSGAYADIRAHLSLGIAYRTYAASYGSRHEDVKALPWFDMAIEEYGKVLTLLEGKMQPGYVAHANQELGAAYRQKAHSTTVLGDVKEARMLYEKAHAAYTACMDQASLQPNDRGLQGTGTSCQGQRNIVDEVLAKLGNQP
ncbi:MAG: tetratricopeptide repeat protein [Chloroflexota bacterium]|nr:tetratricopeptide repeat protein [Chloroflexota bacterium]MDQ5866457.1 tetratricopeptide repeat protein [Chloroflexota bacterium]